MMVAAYKIVHKMAPVHLHPLLQFAVDITQRVGRNLYRLFISSVRTNYGRNNFYFKAAMAWNNLNNNALYNAPSLHNFKLLYT